MYYSEMLSICHIDNTCAKCEKTFAKWSDYHTHVTTTQCIKRQPLPFNSKRNLVGVKQPLSDERRQEIVKLWELKNKENIIS